MKKPNILLIQSDKHRFDSLAVNGNKIVKTPNLDKLASDGMNFTHSFCPIPLCCPARASIITGQWPTEHQQIANFDSEAGREHIEGLPTYATQLREEGYWLGFADKWHVHKNKMPDHSDYGFNKVAPTWEYRQWRKEQGLNPLPNPKTKGLLPFYYGGLDEDAKPDQTRLHFAANMIIDMLDERSKEEEPFMISWEPPEPHLPCYPCKHYMDMYDPKDIEPWPGYDDDLTKKPYPLHQQQLDWGVEKWTWEKDWAPFVARYYATITELDHQIGRVLDKLEQLGLAENTIVVYTTDHGDTTGDHGLIDQHYILYDCVMRVPMIVRWPEKIKAGEVSEEFVCNAIDLCRTFAEAAGAEIPETFSGENLIPTLTGTGGTGREDIFGSYHGNQFGLYTTRMVRDKEYKYIWNPTAQDEFYILANDPGEKNNLIENAKYADLIQTKRLRLIKWMEKTNDSMLNPWTKKQLEEGRKA